VEAIIEQAETEAAHERLLLGLEQRWAAVPFLPQPTPLPTPTPTPTLPTLALAPSDLDTLRSDQVGGAGGPVLTSPFERT
jgi:hypothetical protein